MRIRNFVNASLLTSQGKCFSIVADPISSFFLISLHCNNLGLVAYRAPPIKVDGRHRDGTHTHGNYTVVPQTAFDGFKSRQSPFYTTTADKKKTL